MYLGAFSGQDLAEEPGIRPAILNLIRRSPSQGFKGQGHSRYASSAELSGPAEISTVNCIWQIIFDCSYIKCISGSSYNERNSILCVVLCIIHRFVVRNSMKITKYHRLEAISSTLLTPPE